MSDSFFKDPLGSIDRAFASKGLGEISASTGNLFKGFNHRGGGNVAPANMDSQGYVFFTKPNLNLSYDNVTSVRRLSYLADQDPRSMGACIRSLLSPRVTNNWDMSLMPDDVDIEGIKRNERSIFVDDFNPFITPLSCLLVTLSGWPDIVVDAYTSGAGMRNEVVGWADGIIDFYGNYDLTANFSNIDGDPITAIFQAWIEYSSRVATGAIDPYPQMIAENEVDYQTRIYRIVLDPTRTYVRKIVDACVAWPNAAQLNLDYNAESPFIEGDDQISVRFNAIGARYNDPRTIYTFNRTVETFNPYLRGTTADRQRSCQKLTVAERTLFSYEYSYPYIGDNFELEWWVPKNIYNARKAYFGNSDNS